MRFQVAAGQLRDSAMRLLQKESYREPRQLRRG